MTDDEIEKIRGQVLSEIDSDMELLQEIVVDASILARKRGYGCTGWDALYVIFAERFAWTPEKVRSLTIQELSWLFETFFPD